MFFPEGQVRIFVYGEPVNMRLSYDGLYAKIRNVMGKDPMSGHLFAFINRRATQMKVMYCPVGRSNAPISGQVKLPHLNGL